MRKKVILLVIWFWELESSKLVLFIDFECNVLEKEFNIFGIQDYYFSDVYVKVIRLFGLIKYFIVNFGQMIMVCESGQKTLIIRVFGGSNERKEIG